MITDLVVTIFGGIVQWIGSLIPDGNAPAWLGRFTSDLATWIGQAATVSTWVPIGLALTVMGAILACMAVGFTVKLIRIVASFVTAGGGSAG